MIITPKTRGFICTTTHPTGCERHVAEQIEIVKERGPIADGPKKVLVIGASTGYGLASRITAAFGSGAATSGLLKNSCSHSAASLRAGAPTATPSTAGATRPSSSTTTPASGSRPWPTRSSASTSAAA